MLLNCAGPEAIEEYNHFVYNKGEEKENYADVTLQKAHDYYRTFEAAELQKYKFSTSADAGTEHSIRIQPVNKVIWFYQLS